MHPLVEFSLFNTWVLMKLAIFLTPKKKRHPWKKDPISLKNWLKHPSGLLIFLSLLITVHGLLAIFTFIIALARL